MRQLAARIGELRRRALGTPAHELRVEDALGDRMATVTPESTLREAADRIGEGELSAALVGREQPGILTARDVLDCVGGGHDVDAEQVGDHSTSDARTISPRSPLNDAAATMVEEGFRHLVAADVGGTVGLLAMRDIVRCWVEARATPRARIPIREAMETHFLTLDVDETVHRAAREMSQRGAAAAVVEPAGGRPYPGIVTEREVLHSLRAGGDPATERLRDHLATSMTFSAPDWSLKQAAEAMSRGGFQHIVVVDPHQVRGVIGMRDIVRRWTREEG